MKKKTTDQAKQLRAAREEIDELNRRLKLFWADEWNKARRKDAVAWWAWATGAIKAIGADAGRLADEVERPGSPLRGMFNPDDLRSIEGRFGDVVTLLYDIAPPTIGPDPIPHREGA